MTRKHNSKGRSKGEGRYLRLTHFMMGTPAWRALSVYGRAAYVEVAAIYDGKNNGYLAMGVRRLQDAIGVSDKTATKALNELVAKGFIEIAEDSGFNRKDRHSREFRLTDHPCDRTHQAPSKAFQHWRPEAPAAANDVADRQAPRAMSRAA